jgi:holliday junction DNA helicase RuvB
MSLSNYFKMYRTLKFGVQEVMDKEERKHQSIPTEKVCDFPSYTTSFCSKCNTVIHHEEGQTVSLCLQCENPANEEKKALPSEIIIKNSEINVENQNLVIKNNPKPLNLSEFIGQTENKKSVETTLKIIKQVKPINIFIHGYPGCGKTTLAEIISHELGAKFIYSIPEQLKNFERVSEILNEIQSNEGLTVWMVDEAHNLDKKLINVLLPILQDHKLGNITIREFVMIFATTDYNKLYKKSEALISRFQTKIYLEKYSNEDIITILKQHKKKMDIDVEIPDSDYLLISQNCKRIPREAINLLLKRLVLTDMSEIFKENKIVHNGLNQKDIQILNCLNELTMPIGANFLSQRVGLIEADYCLVYEPFLIESGFVDRTARGRVISVKGKELLRGLSKM